jgi:phosphoglycolate phosphatase
MDSPKHIVFDFDGTIADSLDVAIKISNSIAPEFHCKPIRQEDKEKLRAKKAQEFFKSYGITLFKLPFLALRIRQELAKHITEIKPVKNIEASLRKIKFAGFKLGILTSNSKENVAKFLEKNGFTDIFDFIYTGRNLFGKDKVMRHLFKDKNISQKDIIYVGDETRDIEASQKVGIPIVSVSWGFNSKKPLANLNPDQIADNPAELLGCIQKIFNRHYI